MTALRTLIDRMLASFRRRRDSTLDEEIRSHLDHLERQHRERGLSPQAAHEAARCDFGGIERMKEVYRDQDRLRWVEDLWRDARYAAR
jgi:hypothetical protein